MPCCHPNDLPRYTQVPIPSAENTLLGREPERGVSGCHSWEKGGGDRGWGLHQQSKSRNRKPHLSGRQRQHLSGCPSCAGRPCAALAFRELVRGAGCGRSAPGTPAACMLPAPAQRAPGLGPGSVLSPSLKGNHFNPFELGFSCLRGSRVHNPDRQPCSCARLVAHGPSRWRRPADRRAERALRGP